eukprot:scaffold20.g7753.t1
MLASLAAERLAAEIQSAATRKAASRYDYVKVKVRLGDKLEHYYILSCFLVSRMLTAVKIALELKKQLVDSERLEITQACGEELEEALFGVMRARGFGEEYVRRFRTITRFYQEKRPLIVLICGSACTGKSTLAQQLASRLNLPNVLQTDVLCEARPLLRASGAGPLSSTPLWERPLAEEQLVAEFQAECSSIRHGLDGDLCKASGGWGCNHRHPTPTPPTTPPPRPQCIRDGKPIIIEGLHIDPAIYLAEFGCPMLPTPPADQAERPASSSGDASSSMATASGQPAGAAQQGGPGAGPEHAPRAAVQRDAAAAADDLVTRIPRSLSFDDAAFVPGGEYRQQSPWRQEGLPPGRPRPSSARPWGGRGGAQATFMLRRRSMGSHTLSPEMSRGREVAPQLLRWPPTIPEEGSPPAPAFSPPPGASGAGSGLAGGGGVGKAGSGGAPAATAAGAAAADAAAPPPAPAAGAGPVFVPIVLSVPEPDYESLVRDWYADQQDAAESSAGGGGKEGSKAEQEARLQAVLGRLRALQRHLETRERLGVPVVRVSAGGFAEAADRLHEYILQARRQTGGQAEGEVLLRVQLADLVDRLQRFTANARDTASSLFSQSMLLGAAAAWGGEDCAVTVSAAARPAAKGMQSRGDKYGVLGKSISQQEQLRLALLALTVVPIKLVGAFGALLSFWLCCHLSRLLPPSYQSPVVAILGRAHTRVCLFFLGFVRLSWVRVAKDGSDADSGGGAAGGSKHPRPVAIVSNHASWCDILILMSHFFPSFVARDKTASMPLVGVISQMMGCIYVDREHSDPSQPGVSALVKGRMEAMARGEQPLARSILLFPEGTTTNGHHLLPFKTGAFLAGVPVQPVVIRYGEGRFSPAWEMIPAARHIFLMLCNPLHSAVCYELPVYVPSPEEREDPKLYARNVRREMLIHPPPDCPTQLGFATWLRDSTATFQDKKELEKLLRQQHGLDGGEARPKGE